MPGITASSRRVSPGGFAPAVLAFSAVFFAAFLAWPVWQILSGGLVDAGGGLTFRYVAALLRNELYMAGLRNALLIAAATTTLAAIIALPLAWMTERLSFPGKTLLSPLLLMPMMLPPFVGAIGIRQIFGQNGAFNAALHAAGILPDGRTIDWLAAHPFAGIVLVQAFSLYPILYLNAAAALSHLDPAMEEAAENLGCSGFRRFRRIVLPLIRPGVFAGGTVVFIWAFTELGTPLIFDYTRVTSVQIYEGLKDIGGNPLPYALVAVMLLTSVILYGVGRGLFGRAYDAGAGRSSNGRVARRPKGVRAWLVSGAVLMLGAIAILPHLGVVLVAFSRDWYGTVVPADWTLQNFRTALGHGLTVPAIANSLRFAAASTVIDLVLGVAIAHVIVRSRHPARHVLDTVSMLPLAVPGLVLAFGYLVMARDGTFFAFLNPTKNPTALLIIAYSMRRLPYVIRAAVAGFEQTSVTLEEAAQNLGASPLRAAVRISLPLIRANLLAGALLAFAFAMLEVGDSLVLAQKQLYYPITKAILELFQLLGDGRFIASALGVWAMVFLGLVMAAATAILGRRLGAVFRL